MEKEIKQFYRPVIVSSKGKPRAIKDRDTQECADDALVSALKGEDVGAEGYVLPVKKVVKKITKEDS